MVPLSRHRLAARLPPGMAQYYRLSHVRIPASSARVPVLWSTLPTLPNIVPLTPREVAHIRPIASRGVRKSDGERAEWWRRWGMHRGYPRDRVVKASARRAAQRMAGKYKWYNTAARIYAGLGWRLDATVRNLHLHHLYEDAEDYAAVNPAHFIIMPRCMHVSLFHAYACNDSAEM